jgi:heparan-alpha-glucosaminide N-acetyltransferase
MIAEAPPTVSPASPPEMKMPPARALPAQPARLVSLDAYRGFVMLLMVSAGLGIPKVAAHFKDSAGWQFLAYQTEHAAWRGCTLWDLIQPSFMFIVGVAVPYSLAARRLQEPRFGRLFAHALWRAFALVALGVFLASTGRVTTNFSFAIVLAQIGLAYPFLWLLAWTKPTTQVAATVCILLGYWAAFALYPLPAPGFDFRAVGVPADWSFLSGFEAHWEKNANFAASVDRGILNLFPHEKPFVFNAGGYQTLNFVPSLATMLFGLAAGGLLRSERSGKEKWRWLAAAGIGAIAVGWLWDLSGLCPLVKRIWTPSFAVFSAGWALLLLAFFYGVVDLRGWRRWAFPFVVAGMNSIALYCMSMLLKPWIRERLKIHLGRDVFDTFGRSFAPMMEAAWILVLLWLAAWWMYRRKIFLRI